MGALYRYFKNKDDLFINLIGDIHEKMYLASRAQGYDFLLSLSKRYWRQTGVTWHTIMKTAT